LSVSKDTDAAEEARRIVTVARERGVTLRAIGGVAIRLHCHGQHSKHLRNYNDIDLFGFEKESKGIRSVFEIMHYVPNIKYNMLYGKTHLQFIHTETRKNADVMLDKFRMDHTIDFRPDIGLDELTIPITDLLLTKLQIVRMNEKDVKDIVAILEDHELGHSNDHETLNLAHMAQLCSRDWGLHKTITENMRRMDGMMRTLGIEGTSNLKEKLEMILYTLMTTKKALKWRLRNLIGERVKWYNDIELGEDET
jgi:hypothetical protein